MSLWILWLFVENHCWWQLKLVRYESKLQSVSHPFTSLLTVHSSIWSDQVVINLVCVLFTAFSFINYLRPSGKFCCKFCMSERFCMRHLIHWGWSATAKHGNIRAVAVKWDSQSQSRSAGPDIDFAPSAQSQTQLFYSRPFSLEKSLSYKKVSRNVAFPGMSLQNKNLRLYNYF